MKSEFIDRALGLAKRWQCMNPENPSAPNETAAHNTTANKTAANKALVQQALGALMSTGDVEALAPFLSDDFVHHRPDATSRTKAQWLAAVQAALGPLAGMQIEVLHLLADDNHVVMHSRRRLPPSGIEITVVDIWRVENGRIAEGWELIEPTAQAAANFTWWEASRG